MATGFGKLLGYLFGTVATFCTLNAFVYSIDGVLRWDYMITNLTLLMTAFILYIINQIQLIKEKLIIVEKQVAL